MLLSKVKQAFEIAKQTTSTEAIYLSILLGSMEHAVENGDNPELVFEKFKTDANKLMTTAMRQKDSFHYEQALSNIRILNNLSM
jgi:hypothetical protein